MLQWLFGKKKEEEPKPKSKPKKTKTQQEQQTEDKWMYDFLVQFLNSPLWRVSLLDFVDQNCIVFDNQEQNKFEYTKIHNEFKSLVASLFDGMMQQVGLQQDKLVELLERGFTSKQKKLFNQLLLCDDFLKFKELMLRRNKALEEEAIKALQGSQVHHRKSRIDQQRDIVHESMKIEEDRKRKLEQEQEQVLRKVLQMSKVQAQEREAIEQLELRTSKIQSQKLDEENKKKMEAAKKEEEENRRREQERIAQEKQQEQERKRQIEEAEQKKRRDQERKKQLRAKLNKRKGLDPIGEKPVENEASNLKDLPPLRGTTKVDEPQEKKQEPPAETVAKEEQVKKEEAKVESQEDRKRRLLEQREKIRKKKEEQRKKMLEEAQPQNKVMNIVLQDEGIHDSVHPASEKEPEEKVSKDQIERRKELMRRIKSRIVDDF